MNTLLTDTQIAALDSMFDMGQVWETAADSEQIRAVRTVEASWKTLPWIVSPFTDVDLAARLQYVLARAARYVLENEGSQGTESDEVQKALNPYLSTRRAVSMGFTSTSTASTASTGSTLTGSQIVSAINAQLGSTDWQSGGDDALTGSEIVALLDTAIGNADWQTRIGGTAIVAAIDTALGNSQWKTKISAAAIVTALNTELGNTKWQDGIPSEELLLPTPPAEGSRDNKVPKFDGNTLGWEVDSGDTGGTTDQTARDSAAANTAAIAALEPRLLTYDDQSILANLQDDLTHDLADSTRVFVFLKAGSFGDNEDLSGLNWELAPTLTTGSNVSIAMRVPQALVREPEVTGGRMVYSPSGFQPDGFREYLSHSGDATYAYFTSIGSLSPVGNTTFSAHWEENDLELAISAKHLADEVEARLLDAKETALLEQLGEDAVTTEARSTRVSMVWVDPDAIPADLTSPTWTNPAQMSASQGNAHGPFIPLARVPVANVDDPAIVAARMNLSTDPLPIPLIFSDYRRQIGMNSTHVFYALDGLSVAPLGSGTRATVEFLERPQVIHIPLRHLAAEVLARLLPASGAADGKLVGHASGSPAWVDAPSGGGSSKTWQKVGQWTSLSDSSATNMAYVSNTHFDTLAKVIAAYNDTSGADIAWQLIHKGFGDTAIYARNHTASGSNSYTLYTQSSHVQIFESGVFSNQIFMATGDVVHGSSRASQVTSANPLELWCLA